MKKGPEKRAFLTLCQWQLAWDRCHFTRPGALRPGARASTALGSRSRSSPRGSSRWPKPSRTAAIALRSRCRPRALSFSWHLVRRASRAGRGLEAPRAPWHRVRRRGAQGAPPLPPARAPAAAAPRARAGAAQLWAERIRAGDPDFNLGKAVLKVDSRALQLARDAYDKEENVSHATASAAPLGVAFSFHPARRARARRRKRPAPSTRRRPRRRAGRAAAASSGAPRPAGAAAPGTDGRRARSASARGAPGTRRTGGSRKRRRARSRGARRRPSKARAGLPAVRTACAKRLWPPATGLGIDPCACIAFNHRCFKTFCPALAHACARAGASACQSFGRAQPGRAREGQLRGSSARSAGGLTRDALVRCCDCLCIFTSDVGRAYAAPAAEGGRVRQQQVSQGVRALHSVASASAARGR